MIVELKFSLIWSLVWAFVPLYHSIQGFPDSRHFWLRRVILSRDFFSSLLIGLAAENDIFCHSCRTQGILWLNLFTKECAWKRYMDESSDVSMRMSWCHFLSATIPLLPQRKHFKSRFTHFHLFHRFYSPPHQKLPSLFENTFVSLFLSMVTTFDLSYLEPQSDSI